MRVWDWRVKGGYHLGAKDLAEKNLLQYKDVFSDIVNVK